MDGVRARREEAVEAAVMPVPRTRMVVEAGEARGGDGDGDGRGIRDRVQ